MATIPLSRYLSKSKKPMSGKRIATEDNYSLEDIKL